jgi:phosphatidylglycerophosphatase A
LITLAVNPSFSQVIRSPVLVLAFGFGTGLSARAPGTMGTLAAIPLWYLLAQLPEPMYILIVAICAIVGIFICGSAADKLGVHDHGGIVWDEFVGFWITMAFLPATYVNVIVGFCLFRLFDILKPWPISWLDKNISGGMGIMVDDVVAGLAAAAVIALLHSTNLL